MNTLLAVIPALPLVGLVVGAVIFRLGAVVYNSNKPIAPTKTTKTQSTDTDDNRKANQ